MAKTKTLQVVKPLKYFAYFDPETENINGLSNGVEPNSSNYVEISEDEYKDFGTAKVQLHDYVIDKRINQTGNIELRLITKQLFNEFNFKNKIFEWIVDKPTDKTELIVEWNKLDNS